MLSCLLDILVSVCMCVRACMRVCMCVSVCIRMQACMCMHAHRYVYVHTHVCMFVYVCSVYETMTLCSNVLLYQGSTLDRWGHVEPPHMVNHQTMVD